MDQYNDVAARDSELFRVPYLTHITLFCRIRNLECRALLEPISMARNSPNARYP